MHLEVVSYVETPARMDQYLYPYYARDPEEGRLTKDEAAEVLGCLWVKCNGDRLESRCLVSWRSWRERLTGGGRLAARGDA